MGSGDHASRRSGTGSPRDGPKGQECRYRGPGDPQEVLRCSQDSRPSCEWFPAGLEIGQIGSDPEIPRSGWGRVGQIWSRMVQNPRNSPQSSL